VSTYADRAADHQRHLDRNAKFLTVAQLAARWGVSAALVRAIPATALPYLTVGLGLTREHRRYDPDTVLAYEGAHMRRAG
jgi:hypothetical protein